jgi:hypothetical protein
MGRLSPAVVLPVLPCHYARMWWVALLFSFQANAFDVSTWIVGETYVGAYDKAGRKLFQKNLVPDSWSFDARQCRLWVGNENGDIRLVNPAGEVSAAGFEGRMLSDVASSIFFVWARGRLHKASAEGVVLESYEQTSNVIAQRLAVDADRVWMLYALGNKLWLEERDTKLNTVSSTVISDGVDLWSDAKIFTSDEMPGVWVGFTASITALYSPAVVHVVSGGAIVGEKKWPQRGVFFDGCLEKDRGFIASRSIPSDSGYTVPVRSVLEGVDASGTVSAVYEAETNWLIDSFTCEKNDYWMTQRSIFGSDGSYLVQWNGDSGKFGRRVERLPGKARKIYRCNPS